MNRLAQEAATEHVGVGSDDLKDKNPMRKRISSQPQRERPSENTGWLDLEALARVEVPSEDAAYPIESALLLVGATGSPAESPGEQTSRLFYERTDRSKPSRTLRRDR